MRLENELNPKYLNENNRPNECFNNYELMCECFNG